MSLTYSVYRRRRGQKKVMIAKFDDFDFARSWARSVGAVHYPDDRLTVEAGGVLRVYQGGRLL